MLKKILIFAGVIVLIFAAWGLYLYNKPHQSTKNEQPAETLTAAELYNQFAGNENAANQKFLNKIIEVRGKVSEAQKTDSTFSVLLDADAAGGVNCNLSVSDNKLNLIPKPGDWVVIKGRCVGYIMDVNLNDCVFAK